MTIKRTTDSNYFTISGPGGIQRRERRFIPRWVLLALADVKLLRRRPRWIALVAGVSIPDDDVVAYRAFWLCEDGQWYATIEKDGKEFWRRDCY